jgi:hypothetical protein
MTDPLLRELFERLPSPGEAFPVGGQISWLVAAAACFAVVYKSEINGAITITERRAVGDG